MAQSSLQKKLGMKPGQRVLLLNAPQGDQQMLDGLPADVEVRTEVEGMFDVIQVFVYHQADIERFTPLVLQALTPGGRLWWSYPKKSAGRATDVTRDRGWEPLKEAGRRPVTQIAVDETWSALRFRPLE